MNSSVCRNFMAHLVGGGRKELEQKTLKTWMRASSERAGEQDKGLSLGEVSFVFLCVAIIWESILNIITWRKG